MFTGIVEELGVIENIENKKDKYGLKIKAKKVLEDVNIGDSICTNGVCLTVTDFPRNHFIVDVMPETIRQSNLRSLEKGSLVNLGRALKATDRLGGHIVSGHIDGEGIIKEYKKEGNAWWITVKPDKKLLKYVIKRGSIALDGISLTVSYVDDEDRENEGDFLMASEKVTSDDINFMIKYGRGLVCMPIIGKRLKELDLKQMESIMWHL